MGGARTAPAADAPPTVASKASSAAGAAWRLWSFQREAAFSVHAEHSQRPSKLAPVSYAACRMRVVVIILDHFHVRGQARHTRFAGKPPTPCLECLSGTTVAALIRCRPRSLYFSRPGEGSVRCMSHGTRESLCCLHAYACHYPCKTRRDHPLPHDRSLLMTSTLIDEACAAIAYAAYAAWAQASLQRAEEDDDLEARACVL